MENIPGIREGGVENDWEAYANAENVMNIFVVYNLLIVVLLSYCIHLYFRNTGFKHQVILPMLLILSYPFMGTSIQRGNAVLLVSILLTISFCWYDSKSKVKKEIAMILIAVAAGFKVYPAICGLKYIKDRKYKEACRLIGYGILLFFGPFMFFGGTAGMKQLFLLYVQREAEVPHAGTVRGIIYFILTELTAFSAKNIMMISFFMECLFLIISICCFFMTKIKWKEILFLAGILAVYIPVNWMYTSVYLLPALFMFLKENDFSIQVKSNVSNFISCILFAIIFSLPFYLTKIIPFGIYPCVFFLIFMLLFINMADVIYLKARTQATVLFNTMT